MKRGTNIGLKGVAALPGASGMVQRPERVSWHELRAMLRAANAAPEGAVVPPGDRSREAGSDGDLESTRTLLELARDGDDAARNRLVARYLPALQAWARGRVPSRLRRLTDTDDVVQMTMLRAVERLDRIEYLHEGGFFAYLRTMLRNQVVDLLRRDAARPEGDTLPDHAEVSEPSPFERAVGSEIMATYEEALERLTEQQRAAVTLRLELGLTFREVADATGCPSANAARMLVSRAVVRLCEVMDEHR